MIYINLKSIKTFILYLRLMIVYLVRIHLLKYLLNKQLKIKRLIKGATK